MKAALRLLLLMGVLFGFFGQAVAFSRVPTQQASQEKPATSDDCMQAMEQQKDETGAPCKGLTLDCIAAMGCTVPILAGEAVAMESAPVAASAPLWLDSPILLSGRFPAPDPDPPSLI